MSLEERQSTKPNEWNLYHLEHEHVKFYLASNDSQNQLVKKRRKEKGKNSRVLFAKLVILDRFIVDVSEEKLMDWFVPLPGKLIKSYTKLK